MIARSENAALFLITNNKRLTCHIRSSCPTNTTSLYTYTYPRVHLHFHLHLHIIIARNSEGRASFSLPFTGLVFQTFIYICLYFTPFWHYRSRLGTVSSPQRGKSELDCLPLYMLSSSQSELFNAISLSKMPR